jgi:hypothetical protein
MRYLKDFLLLDSDRYGFRDRRCRLYNDEIVLSLVRDKKFHGELLDRDTTLNVDLHKVSHSVDNIRKVNGNLIGDITVLDTPVGLAIQQLLECGIQLTTSIRATGTVIEDEIVTKLFLITFDLMEKH